jgi:hypothetical protein
MLFIIVLYYLLLQLLHYIALDACCRVVICIVQGILDRQDLERR